MLRMRFLKVAAPDFSAGYLRGDRQDGDTAAVAIVESVDQVQIARTAASRADRQCSRKVRFRSCGKGGRLFVPQMNPLKAVGGANRVRNAVKRVAGQAID